MILTHLVAYRFFEGAGSSTVASVEGLLCFDAVQCISPWVDKVQAVSPWIDETQSTSPWID